MEMYSKIINDVLDDLGRPDYFLSIGVVQEAGQMVIIFTVKKGTDVSDIPSSKDGVPIRVIEGEEKDVPEVVEE